MVKTNETVTSDLAQFGNREKLMAGKLLVAMAEQGLLDDFNHDEVIVMMNKNSGYVFLTNSDYQVAMFNGNKLESFYSCPQCGHEGFIEDMAHNEDDINCQDYLSEIKGRI